jgi:glc operon protein GlcG
MKTIRFLFLTMAALIFLSPTVLSQEASQEATNKRFWDRWTYGEALPPGQARPMTLAIAKQIVAAAYKAACTPSTCSSALAVVDDAGVLIYEETIDGTLADAPELAIEKARASARWRRPTELFQDEVKSGRNIAYQDGTFPHMTISPGGVPLFANGKVVGGFGCAAVGGRGNDITKAAEEEVKKIMDKK